MAEPKVQLVAPIGNITVPGMNVTGVVTATYGDVGTAASIIQGNNIDIGAGIITATSFVGDQIGTYRAASLTGSPDLVIGVVTASSYVGDVTGAATSIIQGTNINAGTFNATTFVGNVTGDITGDVIGHATGIGGSIKQGNNLNVGVATAVWYGDGSSLTGVASSAYIAQEVTTGIGASGYETIIDLTYGNLIYYKGRSNTTVGFASTAATQEVTIVRDTSSNYDLSFTTGAVTIDGSDDYISIPASSEYDIGTGDFTVECWINADVLTTSGHYRRVWEIGASTSDSIGIDIQPEGVCNLRIDDSVILNTGSGVISTGTWTHIALCRKSSTITLYINGTTSYSGGTSSASNSTDIDQSSNTFYIGANHAQPANSSWDGKISNFRYGTSAVYDGDFTPPLFELSAVTGTKILCCQSDSSATTAADSPGTLTVNGTVTAAAASISQNVDSGTITWPDRVRWADATTPTLIDNPRSTAFQIFHFLSVDSGLTYNAWEVMKDDATGGPYTLWTWGYNDSGQLAQNNLTSRSSPTQIPGTNWDTMTLSGSSGSAYSNSWISTKTDGTLWAWGENNEGQLGQSSTVDQSSPVQIGTGTDWAQAEGDDEFKGAIKTDGTAWVWGINYGGALGLNNDVSPSPPATFKRSSPTQLPGTTWSKISTGYRNMKALKTDGTIWTWGQSGDGSNGTNDNTWLSSPTQIGGGAEGGEATGWSDVFACREFAAGIKTDGTLWVWGRGHEGVHGQNNRTNYSSPMQVPGTTWKTFSGGTQPYVLATKTDGTLWAWGNNWKGNLGLNSINPNSGVSSPTQVGTDTTWSQAGAAEFQSQATKTDGTLWTWGDNVNSGTYGSLGLNDLTQRSSPTQIPGTDWIEASGGGGFGMAFKVI